MGSSKRYADTRKRTVLRSRSRISSTQPHSHSSLEQLLTVPPYEDVRWGEVKCNVENKELRDGHDRITGATAIAVGVAVAVVLVVVVLVAFVAPAVSLQ
jgi:hypothetical protein